ncbi:MAG: glycosyltransferase [Agromyces sp.]
MSEYDVDVIIAVHTASRPIRRAVASVLDHTASAVRVNVVAHNIDAEVIRRNLAEYASHDGVRLLSLSDGIPSPAGPMNLGLERATAPYFALLGSDDELAPGALDSWLAIARTTGATTVLARIERVLSGTDPYPPVRRGRTRDLDPVKDRLAYRSAPLGLVRRTEFGELRFTAGLRSGEDLEFTAALWFTGSRLAYDRGGPPYIAHEDAEDRVTETNASVADDFAFLDAIHRAPWFASLSRTERTALGVKTLRVHYFDAIGNRLASPGGIAAHREALDRVITRVERMSPGSVALLARVDRKVIDAIRSPEPDPDLIRSLLAARWQGGPLGTLMTRNPLLAFHRQAPYRTMRSMVAVE